MNTEQKLLERIDGITEWLKREHPTIDIDQKHLDEGTIERAYWHYGYLCALRDFLKVKVN